MKLPLLLMAAVLCPVVARAQTSIPVTSNLPLGSWTQLPDLTMGELLHVLPRHTGASISRLDSAEFSYGVILSNPSPKPKPETFYIRRILKSVPEIRQRVLEVHCLEWTRPRTVQGFQEMAARRNFEFHPEIWETRLLFQSPVPSLTVGDAIEEKSLDELRLYKLETSLQPLTRDIKQSGKIVPVEIQIHPLSASAGGELTTKLMKAGFSNCKNTAWNKITGTLPAKSLDGLIQLTSVQSIRPLRNY